MADEPLTLAAYSAGPVKTAYVEPAAVGDLLPEMPLFLEDGDQVIFRGWCRKARCRVHWRR